MNNINELQREYYLDGQIKREIHLYNGRILSEIHFENGKVHKLDGPAHIKYRPNGKVKHTYYFINGRAYTKRTFDSHPQVIEFIENKRFYEVVEEVLGE